MGIWVELEARGRDLSAAGVSGSRHSVTQSEGQETPLADGKAGGDSLSFTAKVDRGGNTITYTFSGKITGDEIQFKREGGQGQAREFTARRVK